MLENAQIQNFFDGIIVDGGGINGAGPEWIGELSVITVKDSDLLAAGDPICGSGERRRIVIVIGIVPTTAAPAVLDLDSKLLTAKLEDRLFNGQRYLRGPLQQIIVQVEETAVRGIFNAEVEQERRYKV